MPNLLSGSRIMQFLSRLGELILLNLCFLLCSLPIVTAGAAFAALYTVCTRFGTEREGATFRTFFRSFRENLKQGTLAWVLELILCAFSGYFALVFCFRVGVIHYAFIPFLVLLAATLIVFGYVYPLLGQFENTFRQTIRNACILSLGYLPRSVLAAAINVAPLVLLAVAPELFMRTGIVWFLLYFSGTAYLNSQILRPVFQPYLSRE